MQVEWHASHRAATPQQQKRDRVPPSQPTPPRRLASTPLFTALLLATALAPGQSAFAQSPASSARPPAIPATPDSPAASLTAADAESQRAAERPLDALRIAESLLATDPANDDAFRVRVLALADIGASRLAADLQKQRPALFAVHERERIEGDSVARAIGWAGADPVDPRQRLAEAQAALDAFDALERDTPRETNWERTRHRVDRLAALNRLQRHQEVADGYAALVAEGIEIPGYALGTVGDSLLALRRPDDAVPVLDAAIAHAPADIDARILLAYAWLEQERFDRAMPILEQLSASQEPWPRRAGARGGYENWDRFSADLNLALAKSHGNDHQAAEDMLAGLSSIAPRNASLHSAAAAVEQRRGRPEAALQRYDIALTLEPWQRDAMAGRVGALTALDRIDDARTALDAMHDTHPEDLRLERIDRDLARHRGVQATVTAYRGRSDAREGTATASPLGSRDGGWALDLRSPLIDDRWRLGVIAQDDWADFESAGSGTRERTRFRSAGVGAYYRHDRLGASVTAARITDDADDGATALTASADWRLDDAWTGTVRVARNDPEASLQARRIGIFGDSLTLGAQWAPSESLAVDARLSRLRYDDGNTRDQLGVDGRMRLAARPHWMLDGLASVYTSRGSDGDSVGYFNPERDASATVGLRLDHITWRRYETAFQQRVEVTAGPYWQDGYGSHWVPSLGYRHLWRRDGHEFEYGVALSRPVYDGRREDRVMFDAAFRWGGAR